MEARSAASSGECLVVGHGHRFVFPVTRVAVDVNGGATANGANLDALDGNNLLACAVPLNDEHSWRELSRRNNALHRQADVSM